MPQDTSTETAIARMTLIGTQSVNLNFNGGKQTTRAVIAGLSLPANTQLAIPVIQDQDVEYTSNDHFDFGRIQFEVDIVGSQLTGTISLRDDNENRREWQGSMRVLALYFGF